MTSHTDTTVDPQRLMVATHELGHAIAWQNAGFRIDEIKIHGRGSGTTGYVQLEDRPNRTPDEARDYLIGLLAGREAEHTWCDITRTSPTDQGSSIDLDVYRKYRKYDDQHERWVTDLTDRELRTTARKLITAHWAQIERLAEQLADRGTVRL